MKPILSVVFAFSLIVLTQSCLKEDVEILPAETHNAAGTFACMYDGKLVKIDDAYAVYYYDKIDGGFRINIIAGHSSTVDPREIYLILDNTYNTEIYPIKEYRSSVRIVASLQNTNYNYDYVSYSGSVQLTKIDTITKIISGAFNADLVLSSNVQQAFIIPQKRPGDKDTISIRSGRFDLPLKYMGVL